MATKKTATTTEETAKTTESAQNDAQSVETAEGKNYTPKTKTRKKQQNMSK